MCSNFFKRVALWSLKHALWQRPGYALSMDRRRKWAPALSEVMSRNLYENLGNGGPDRRRSTTISRNLRKHYSRSRRA
jgi:hypothetical protein